MFANRSSDWMLSLKKVGYWFWLLPVALVPLSYHLAQGSTHADAWAFLLPIVVFGIIPVLDALLGRDRVDVADAKGGGVGLQRRELRRAFGVGDRQAVARRVGPCGRGEVVIGNGQGQVRPADLQPTRAQAVEGPG